MRLVKALLIAVALAAFAAPAQAGKHKHHDGDGDGGGIGKVVGDLVDNVAGTVEDVAVAKDADGKRIGEFAYAIVQYPKDFALIRLHSVDPEGVIGITRIPPQVKRAGQTLHVGLKLAQANTQ
jgi:hypothetical protein